MIDDTQPNNTLPRIVKYNIAELLEGVRQMENLLDDFREIIWSLEDKLREEGMNVPARKI